MSASRMAQSLSRKKNLVLFGAPGVGKGTYGRLIMNEFGFPTFSMGDYFRKIINDDHPEGT